jgi:hypothetical protein
MRLTSIVLWLTMAGLGVTVGYALAMVSEWLLWPGAVLAFLLVLTLVFVVPVLGRSGLRRLGASGLLFGIAAILRLGYWSGPNDCSGPLFSCVPVAEPVWSGLTAIALGVALIMLGTELRAARPAS